MGFSLFIGLGAIFLVVFGCAGWMILHAIDYLPRPLKLKSGPRCPKCGAKNTKYPATHNALAIPGQSSYSGPDYYCWACREKWPEERILWVAR